MQACVVFERETGHVFALATGAAPLPKPAADQPEEAAAALRALVGAALPTRGYLDGATGFFQSTEFTIPGSRLALLATEVDAAMLLAPLKYAVRDQESIGLSPSDPLPQLVLVGSDALRVTLSAETPEELPVLLQVVPDATVGGDPQTVQGAFRPASATKQVLTLSLAAPLSAGGHAVLMLVRSFRSGIRRIVAP
jgi:hypothetical protein